VQYYYIQSGRKWQTNLIENAKNSDFKTTAVALNQWWSGPAHIIKTIFFFFLLFHQLAEDEALIIFLQTSLFLVFPYTIDNFMPLSSKSSLTLSIHLFLCLPLLLSPLTCPCSATFGSLFHSILSTCPNHVSLLLLIFSITVSSAPLKTITV